MRKVSVVSRTKKSDSKTAILTIGTPPPRLFWSPSVGPTASAPPLGRAGLMAPPRPANGAPSGRPTLSPPDAARCPPPAEARAPSGQPKACGHERRVSALSRELLNDAIFGAIYYRVLLRSGPLTRRVGEELVEQVLRGHRSGAGPGPPDLSATPAP